MIRRIVGRILTPVIRRVARALSKDEQWERVTVSPSVAILAPGSHHEFDWYFEGQSAVAVVSLATIHAWLAGCTYADDLTQFGVRDYWQHPVEFERQRSGDCEDFALWAWRKLVELDYDADFVLGYSAYGDSTARHAWIVFRRDGVEYVYEPTRKALSAAVQKLTTVSAHYTPEYGVGRDLVRHTYLGRLSVAFRDDDARDVGPAREATSLLTPVAADIAARVP